MATRHPSLYSHPNFVSVTTVDNITLCTYREPAKPLPPKAIVFFLADFGTHMDRYHQFAVELAENGFDFHI